MLIDRCLSPGFKRGVEAFGLEARLLRDVYPDDGQQVQDVQWIADAAHHGFIVLTSNPAIVSVDHEINLIRTVGTKVFCISNAQHTKEGRAMIFGRHWLRIVRRSQLAGACFWRLNPNDRILYDIP